MNVSLKIKIFDAKGTHLVPIAKSTVTVGSASHCDVVLNHPTVSQEHIRAWCEGGRIWVQDLGSSHGSAINGIRLPPLKPMLVREIDVLKLGECPATMSMEPNLVRAPVVKAKVDLDEFTATDIKAIIPNDPGLEKNRNEAEKVSRELAEVKLQLQMAKLDRDSSEELRKETAQLRDELNKLTEEKRKLKDSFQQVDADKKNYRRQLETEVSELKLKALREAKEQREEDQRKFGQWKEEALKHLTSSIKHLGEQKVKAWITRPLSKDMMLEWESDLNEIFREILLAGSTSTQTLPVPDAPVKSDTYTGRMTQQTATGIKKPVKPSRRSRKAKEDSIWTRFAVFGVAIALIIGAVWWVKFKPRGVEGSRNAASQAPARVEAPPVLEPPTPTPAPPAAKALPQKFAPVQDKAFKGSYTDNVLFTLNYAEAEMNMDFRNLWIKSLNKVGKSEWKLDSRTLGSIATNELVLIQDLNRLRLAIGPAQENDRIGQMRQREGQYIKELQRQLGKKASLEKFMKLKRAFFTRNQVYLTRENR